MDWTWLTQWMPFDGVDDESLWVALVIAEVTQGTVLGSLMFLIILLLLLCTSWVYDHWFWSLLCLSPYYLWSFSVIHLCWIITKINALSNIGINIQCAAGALQLCAGQTSGMEATIHSMWVDRPSGVDVYTWWQLRHVFKSAFELLIDFVLSWLFWHDVYAHHYFVDHLHYLLLLRSMSLQVTYPRAYYSLM